jgi:hypothetical protein
MIQRLQYIGRLKLTGDPKTDIQALKDLTAKLEEFLCDNILTTKKPIADGTYTMGYKLTPTGQNGTITVSNGLITNIQSAT